MGKRFQLPRATVVDLCRRHPGGSFKTQKAREMTLFAAVREIERKFHIKKLDSIKQKHIRFVIDHWRDERQACLRTLKNLAVHLRWMADSLGKREVMPSNEELGLEKRTYITNEDKAWQPSPELVARLDDAQKIHVDLMYHFGLRFDEAAKFRPGEDAAGTKIRIIHGPKTGRTREVPVLTDAQRSLLERAARYCADQGTKSIIPADHTGKEWGEATSRQYARLGMTKRELGVPHGLRHHYAQRRYRELSGREKCPCEYAAEERKAIRKAMTAEERQRDHGIRLQISQELGHNRVGDTGRYLGSWGR